MRFTGAISEIDDDDDNGKFKSWGKVRGRYKS